jgi:hygromycin-B 7''-O-kinase
MSEAATGLPKIESAEAFHAWRLHRANWLQLVADIARHHGLPHGDPQPFATGTNLVVALNAGVILKVFPPLYRAQFVSERATLRQLHGQLELPIPAIVAEGEIEAWSYLAITRLPGTLGSEVWPNLSESDKQTILTEIGRTIATVQSVPLGPLATIEPHWPEFIARQRENCRARHIRLGLPQHLMPSFEALLDEVPSLIPLDAPPVILTGEYIPENFLLAEGRDGWHLAGLIDFGDVLTGWGEYDLLGPSAFMSAGYPRRVRSLFTGYDPDNLDPIVTRRLMALMFLHRASDPLRHIPISGWQHSVANVEDLERLLWPM